MNVVDLGGKTMLPGFLDGHSHFINAIRMAIWANLSAPPVGSVTTIADLIEVLRDEDVGEPHVALGPSHRCRSTPNSARGSARTHD
jgi:predicted amidohydrolase YtcJ